MGGGEGGTPRYLPPPTRAGWGRGYPKVPAPLPRYLPHPPWPDQEGGTPRYLPPTRAGWGRDTPRYLPPSRIRRGGGTPRYLPLPPAAKVPTPPPGQDRGGGTPRYLPNPRQGTYPPARAGWGEGGIPRYLPPPHQGTYPRQGTYPPPPGQGTFPLPPTRAGWGKGVPQGTYPHQGFSPPPPPAKDLLLHVGRYASCVHAEGLSCLIFLSAWYELYQKCTAWMSVILEIQLGGNMCTYVVGILPPQSMDFTPVNIQSSTHITNRLHVFYRKAPFT